MFLFSRNYGGELIETAGTLSLCGMRIDALTLGTLLQLLNNAIVTRERLIILNHNLHSLYLYQTSQAFRDAYSLASLVYVDGMPVVWLGRLAGLPIIPAHRITFLDNFEAVLHEAVAHHWRLYYLGSTPGVNERALQALRSKFPGLLIAGQDGYFSKSGPENDRAIATIIEYKTDILFIGMGMPAQEQWLADNHAKLKVSAILTSGGTLDYVLGDAYKPPPWAGPLGLYGVMRLTSNPTRLWQRYLLEPLLLVAKLAFPLLQQRRHKLRDR